MALESTQPVIIQQIQAALEQHEALGSNYLYSPHANEAYDLAAALHKLEPCDEVAVLLMTAAQYQGKQLLKQYGASAEATQKKFIQVIEIADRLIGSNDPDIKHAAQRKKASAQVRLSRFEDAAQSFAVAREEQLNPEEEAQLSLAEHLLYREKDSPFRDLGRSLELLESAKANFQRIGDNVSEQMVNRYIMLALIHFRKPLRAGIAALKVRPRRDLIQRLLNM